MSASLPGGRLGGGASQLAVALAFDRPRRDFRQHIRLAQDQVLVRADLDLGAAVLGEDDLVALRQIHGDEVPALVPATRTDREHTAALRLFPGGVRQDDPAHRRLLLLEHLDDQAVAKRLQIHATPPVPLVCRSLSAKRETEGESLALSDRECRTT